MTSIAMLKNPHAHPTVNADLTWPDDKLPLVPDLGEAAPFPVEAMPPVLLDCAQVLQRTMRAPDGMICGSLLAAGSLAAQGHADIVLPYGAPRPLSLNVVSVAESGERKSAIDGLVLRPHYAFEKVKQDEYQALLTAYKALSKVDRENADEPKKAVFLTGDPTMEGLVKLLANGLGSLGIFSGEGGRFLGGHGMSEEAQLRTGAGLAQLWDGDPIDRVRSGDGAYKLYGRRVAFHLMVQPLAAMNWLGNKTLRDQGLFSRCLVGYPTSTAGTRLYVEERAQDTPEYAAYVRAMDALLLRPWATNELGELTPRLLSMDSAARAKWIALYDEIEKAIPSSLAPIRGLASKAAEHIGRIAGVFEMVGNPDATQVSEETMDRAAGVMQWYLSEALRLSSAQPRSETADRASHLWEWLSRRGKSLVCLAELIQYGPAKLRKAKDMREAMHVLEEHYHVRTCDPIEWEGRMRNEAWEVRL